MDVWMASEESYKNGYEDGVISFAEYLKDNSVLYDYDSCFSFRAIDIDDLNSLVEVFLNK